MKECGAGGPPADNIAVQFRCLLAILQNREEINLPKIVLDATVKPSADLKVSGALLHQDTFCRRSPDHYIQYLQPFTSFERFLGNVVGVVCLHKSIASSPP